MIPSASFLSLTWNGKCVLIVAVPSSQTPLWGPILVQIASDVMLAKRVAELHRRILRVSEPIWQAEEDNLCSGQQGRAFHTEENPLQDHSLVITAQLDFSIGVSQTTLAAAGSVDAAFKIFAAECDNLIPHKLLSALFDFCWVEKESNPWKRHNFVLHHENFS